MRVALRVLLAILIITPAALLGDTTAQTLPFSQNWTNTGLITVTDNWGGVPGITGFRGDGLTGATGTDPQTLTAADAAPVIDVNANQTNPNTFATGGTAEFHIADPVVGLTGSGTADAPYLQIYLNTTGFTAINVSYNVRDLDGSIDSAIQPLALHYRVGGSGSFTNLPAAFIADASSGPSLATLVTPISVILPAACENQALVELRIMTTNAAGNDEWLGIDDILVTGTAVPALTIDDVTLAEGDAGTTTYTFTASLSIPAGAGGVTFDIATADNTATTADNDYVAQSLTGQTIPMGSTGPYNFNVTVNGDTNIEPNESFFVNVTSVTGAIVTDGQGSGTIQDDDSPPVLSVNDVSSVEGNSGTTNFTFTVSLSRPAPAGVTFDIATADNDAVAPGDYTAKSLTGQTIPAGSSTYSFDVIVNGDSDFEPNETFFVNVTNIAGAIVGDSQGQGMINNDDVAITPIHDIQGPGASSPIIGASVTTRGIVTGVKYNGFFIQEPDADVDADPATSEGIFVFTSGAPPAAAVVGAYMQVTGTVADFVPPQDPLQPPLTELTSPTVVQLTTGNPLPAAIPLTTTFPDPAGVHDQLERLEGMRVSVASLTVTAPTLGNINETNATATSTGVFYGVVTGVARPFREPGIQSPDPAPSGGGTIPPIPRFDSNPERIRVDSDGLTGGPLIDVGAGAAVTGLTGPLDYGFRTYTILPDPIATIGVTGGPTATPARVPTADEFTVASFNMLRFFDTVNDPAIGDPVLTAAAFDMRLNKASLAIRDDLHAPDVLAVIEMENLTTLQDLAGRISADAIAASQPDPLYAAYLVEGNDVGGIDVGFLVKTASVVGVTPRVSVTEVVQELDGTLFVNPDSSTSTLNDRPPLRLTATINYNDGRAYPVTVIVNHLRSLNDVNSEDPGSNGWATEGARVRAKRQKQAEDLANLIQARQTANPTENIVIVGDFNAFEFNDGLVDVMNVILGTPPPDNETAVPGDGVDLVNPDFELLTDNVPLDTAHYSYTYDGNAQNLDHIAINQALKATVSVISLDHPRIDPDFPAIAMNDGTAPVRLSDHEPVIAYFALEPVNDPPVNAVPVSQTTMEDTPLSFSILGGNQIQVSDADADPLPVQVSLSVSSGTLLLASTAGVTVFGDGTGTVTLSGSIAAINGALDGLLYIPAPNWSGVADLFITTNDLGNTGSGGPKTDTDFVSIFVVSVNDAPVVTGLPLTGTEDTPITLSGVAVSDVDAGVSLIHVTITNSLGVNLNVGTPGSVVVTGNNTPIVQLDGTTAQITAAINTISLVPTPDFAGTVFVLIVADDLGNTGLGGAMIGSLNLPIDFTAVNDGPTLAVPGPLTTAETTPVALPGIVVGDVDSAANSINLTLTSTIGTFTLGGSAGVIVVGSGTGSLTMTGAVSDLAAAIATLIFTPPSAGGSGTITVTINDGGFTGGAPLSATNTIAITVTDVNNAPIVTTPGAQTTNEDTGLVFSTGNGNRISVSDADSGAANVQVAINVANGVVTLASTAGLTVSGNGTGAITITGPVAAIDAALEALQFSAPVEYSGPASITVGIDDLGNTGTGGPLTAIGTVTIDVVAVNDAPTVAGVPLTGTEDSLVVLSGIFIADVDAPVIEATITTSLGVPLALMTPGAVISVVGSGTPTLVVTGSPSAVNMALTSVQFTPPTEFSGAATINVTVSDLGNTGTGGVLSASTGIPLTITSANDAPTVTVPGAQTTPEETNLSFSTATANAISVSDADAGATPIQVTLTTTIGTLTAGPLAGVTIIGSGTATITATGTVADLNAAMQTLVLVVPGAIGGTGTLSVTVNDLGATGTGGPLSATANVAITIADENDAPALVLPGAQTTNEGIDLVFSTLNGNAISISDADAGTNDVQLTLSTSLGTMTLGSTAGLTSVVGNGTAAITVTGPIAAINAALQNLILAVPAGVGGAGTISLTVSDLGNTGSGGTLTASGSINVTVNDVNDPPTLTVPGAQTTPEGTSLVFATANGNAISVTDIDAAGGSIRVTLTTTFGTLSLGSTAGLAVTGNGTAAITAEGSVASLNAALQGLTLTVSTTGEQTGTISVGVNDLGLTGSGGAQSAAAAIAVTVSGVNDAPTVVVPAAQTTAEGVDLVFIAANGNSITVDDIDAGTGAIQVTVSTTAGTLSLGGIAGLTVAGNGTTSVTATGTIANLNAGVQGLTLTNTLDTSGTATITVVVSDLGLTGTGGVLTATGNIAVTITDVNDAPTIAAPPSQTTPEDVDLIFGAANGNAITIADVDAGTGEVQITLTTTIGTLTLSSAAGVVIVGNGTTLVTATGTVAAINAALEGLTLSVPAATSGTGTLTLNVTDQGNTGTGGPMTATANVAITIDSINDPPVVTIASLNQDGTSGFVVFSASRGNGITISDPDADTSPIEITLAATCGTITLSTTAGLTFTAGDGTGDTTMTFTGTMTSINAALEGMTFTVQPGCTGSATLVISVNDLGATGTNGAQVATATINISAAAVAAIPTLSFFGLLALGLALIAAAGFRLK